MMIHNYTYTPITLYPLLILMYYTHFPGNIPLPPSLSLIIHTAIMLTTKEIRYKLIIITHAHRF